MTFLSRADNLRTVLRGATPAWIPFAPNFRQWFIHHQSHGSLPEELRGCRDYLDAMIAFDCDIFSRNIDSGCVETDVLFRAQREVQPSSTGQRCLTTWQTPHGALREVVCEQTSISTSHTEEYRVKDWNVDGRAFRAWFDQREPAWDEASYLATADRVGDRGLVNLACFQTPLKFLHNNFGLDGACFFCSDHPDEAKALCDERWARLRPLIQRMADHPRVDSIVLMDNVDTPFYPPSMARTYWAPYVADAVGIMRARGKSVFVHACGKLRGLARIFAECGVTGLEGISHAPIGDWDPTGAVATHPGFVYVGGFSCTEQGMDHDAMARFYEGFLAGMPRQRVIFSSSCQTAIETPWERLVQVRDLVRAWGGRPPTETDSVARGQP
jgi:hypothetical protein